MVIISAFQAEDDGSIPFTCSKSEVGDCLLKVKKIVILWLLKILKGKK